MDAAHSLLLECPYTGLSSLGASEYVEMNSKQGATEGAGNSTLSEGVAVQRILEAEREHAKAELAEERRRGKERAEQLLKQLEEKWTEVATLRRAAAPP